MVGQNWMKTPGQNWVEINTVAVQALSGRRHA